MVVVAGEERWKELGSNIATSVPRYGPIALAEKASVGMNAVLLNSRSNRSHLAKIGIRAWIIIRALHAV
jgi:hypothetical protein